MAADAGAPDRSPMLEGDAPKPHYWLIYSYCFFIFMEWSIIVPSIMEYLMSLGDSPEEAAYHYAWAQTAFAMAQFCVSMVAGLLLLKLKSFRLLFLVSAVLMAAGNIMYALADPSVADSIPLLIAGRVVAGAGAGGNSIGFAYCGVTCKDKKKFVAVIGRYRTVGVVATVLGAAIAGIFSFADFHVGALHCYTATLPCLFTALCFIIWAFACAILVKATPPTDSISKAYRRDARVVYWFVILALSSCVGSTLIYCMPTIMQGYGWSSRTQSLFFTITTVGTLVGSVIGQEKKVVNFNPRERSFNGFPVAMCGLFVTMASLVALLLEANLASTAVKYTFFVIGTILSAGAFSLLNNIGGACLMLTFTEAEKTGMSPFTGGAVAFGKIVAPMLADAGVNIARGVHTADWNVVFIFWLVLAFVLTGLCFSNKHALRSAPPAADKMVC